MWLIFWDCILNNEREQTIGVESVVVLVNEIDSNAQILLIKNIPLVVLFQGGRLVFDEAVRIKWVIDELWIKWYIG